MLNSGIEVIAEWKNQYMIIGVIFGIDIDFMAPIECNHVKRRYRT
jgi:hypothetical protein